ncbi:hypothetical protein MNBD_GAMMA26-1447 [hydrothermal vent metagenome]|uniref:General secretion pathway GspH domain-containing protein n=1 Tax=hydrothermal vent metagenome TaxID=652676 RepID=A0A3B1BLP2_9ZZZZ
MLKRNSSGFTLIELIVTIVIMGILIGIGVPSFQDMMNNSRASTHANNLVTAFNMARSEAVKRGQTIEVCSANAGGTACAGAGVGWGSGWLVWWDGKNDDAAGNCDASNTANSALAACEIIRAWSTGTGAPTTTTTVDSVSFGSRGEMASSSAEITLDLCSSPYQRTLTINPIGHIRSNRGSC